MSGTRPLATEQDGPRPVQVTPTPVSWRQGLRQIVLALTRSGSSSREDTMTVLRVANSMDPVPQVSQQRA